MQTFDFTDGYERICLLNDEEARAMLRLLRRAIEGDGAHTTEFTFADGAIVLVVRGTRA